MQHDYAKNLSRREIVARGRALRLKVGQAVSFRKFRAETRIPANVIDQMFGGWRRLRRLIEPAPGTRPPRRKRTLRQLVESLQRLDRERTERITQEEFCTLAGVSPYEIARRFGSWRQFREAAGMSRRSPPRRLYTNRELLDELLYYYLRTGQRPSKWLIGERGGRQRVVRLRNRFGSWKYVELNFEAYRQMYFLSRDPNWSPDEHEQTFVPHTDAKLE